MARRRLRRRGHPGATELQRPRRGRNPEERQGRFGPDGPRVATTLARLSERENFTGDDELVFAGEVGGFQDATALRERYRAALNRAELRKLRFHDLRHTFGTLAVRRADVPAVQAWMGHADIQ